MLDKFRQRIANIINPTKNAMSLPNQFLRYGNRTIQYEGDIVEMKDQEIYTGYGYAAIRNRANVVARVASDEIRTWSEKELEHQYLDLIRNSIYFSEYKFWYDISTYLDLEGVYYLMVLRNGEGDRIGNAQEFKLLNPYQITRVLSTDQLTVAGYVEARKGMVREIPPHMIIEMRELNPFNEDNPYSMTDAAKESKFTLKTAGDYTRHALKGNINAPGIMTTDVILEDKEFQNFIARVRDHTKGEPIFGNGSGSVTYENMQTELSKAALKDVNELNRQELFAVSGVSKTGMGIEESGTTRETSRVQKDLQIEDHILPRIQLVLDALNLDYREKYPVEFNRNKVILWVENPTKEDYENDLKKTEVQEKELGLYTKLIRMGADPETASKYATGELELDELGDIEPIEIPVMEKDKEENQIKNDVEFEDQKSGIVQDQEGALMNAITNIDQQLVLHAMNRIPKVTNDIEEDKLITKTQKKESAAELAATLLIFYGIVVNFKSNEVMRDRTGEFALGGVFKMTPEIRRDLKQMSRMVAESHVQTVSSDIFKSVREAALAGKSVPEIQSELRRKYSETISKTRAKTIARTETNRAFTMSQFEADKQFVQQNDLQGQAFKKWHTRSDNPCEFCLALEAEGEVPFEDNFRDLGDTVTALDKDGNRISLDVNFTDLEAGNAHPNCSCEYELIIKRDNTLKNAIQLLQEVKKEKNVLEKDKQEFEQVVNKLNDMINE